MAKDKVYITLEVTDKGTAVVRGFDKNTEQAFNKMKAHAKASTTSMGSSLQKLKAHWVAYSVGAVAAVVAVKLVMTKMINTLRTWTRLSMAQEDAEIGLTASLKANLEYTDQLNTQYQEFATNIQKVTRYGDEEVLQLMALQKNLGVAANKLEEATKMAIGLATATGRDVQSMSMYIALAQQGEFTMLRRYIPALRSTTDETEQLRIITEFAARGFKVAQDTTQSFSGGLKQMGNLWGDLREKLGSVITENETVLALMKQTREWLIRVGEKVDAWREANQELIDQKLADYLKTTKDILVGIGTALKTVYDLTDKTVSLLKTNKNVLYNIPLIGQGAIVIEALRRLGEYRNSLEKGQGIIRMKIEKPAKPELPLLEDATPKMAYNLGLINAELRVFQLQSEAAWAAYQKGIKEAIPKQNEFMAGIYGERTAIILLEQEIEEGLAQSLKSIDEQGKSTFDDLKNAITGWASTFSAQLTDMVWAADRSFADILESFGRMITQMLIQKAVVEPMLSSLFGGATVASAHGNVFNNGQITPFGHGGIVKRSTIFPMAAGAGLMGEKGPEGILPLTRTKSGDLGVKAEGGSPNIQINMINQSGQPLQATKQGSRQESGKFIIDVVVKELQRGKTLRQMIRSTT